MCEVPAVKAPAAQGRGQERLGCLCPSAPTAGIADRRPRLAATLLAIADEVFLSRWTCKRPWTRSTCSQRNEHNSDALKPCRKAIKIMVASRCPCRLFPAAFMSRSTSRSVRYSRVRYSAFGSRPRGTVLFTVLGALTCDLDFIGNFPCARAPLFL